MDLEKALDSFSKGWDPKPGEKLIGVITGLDMLESKFGGNYPVVTVQTDDGNEFVFHAWHTVAKNELGRLRPKVGEKIGIAYHSKDDKAKYERYRVLLNRPETNETTIDWQAVQDDARSELESVDVPQISDDDVPSEEEMFL